MAIMALHSASTGLRALSTQLDVVSNNLANANNDGFKASRVNFEDLFYQNRQQPGVQNAQADIRPTGISIGLGTRVSGTQLDMSQGSAIETGRPLDVMISGNGFFQVKSLPNQGDGLSYTRTGKFFVNANGDLVLNSSDGFKLDPPINVPTNTTAIDIGQDGRVFATQPGSTTPTEVGQIQLATFVNPQGLLQIGGNLYQKTDASGQATLSNPGSETAGTLKSGFVEASNVDPVRELVDLIKTQRTFELN
ncbi:MAG: flagellar basal-body rod protein FlgG, partial [Phycisphaerae bacterium]